MLKRQILMRLPRVMRRRIPRPGRAGNLTAGDEKSEGRVASTFGSPQYRLASTQRRYDTAAEKWIDGDTNWYTVTGTQSRASATSQPTLLNP